MICREKQTLKRVDLNHHQIHPQQQMNYHLHHRRLLVQLQHNHSFFQKQFLNRHRYKMPCVYMIHREPCLGSLGLVLHQVFVVHGHREPCLGSLGLVLH